ncbi:diacylglycerol/polyprenol kinase family protein [Maribellus maritimus]|uniref:diacylglycerol/polyprenol kinase family protein n=1 Tax=Maribellus maritimus TaxID=2870838 RepID=UPI001EE9EC2C|nr:phosphatidate cytidylyltransferase [Maribellus maritimus]MCG6190397.1 phosphatidate cytidylyltransferase [Maribellus maritimus]
MGNIVVLSFVYLVGIGLLLIFNELVYRRLNPTGEITRKFAHFTSVLATVPFPYIFPSHWYILVLALLFAAVLFITRNGKQLKSIHGVTRKSVGSYLLPLSIYITFLISNISDNKFIYILPMLILAISDPMAAILGINLKAYNGRIKWFGKKLNKTWLGSGAFLVSSLVISLIALYFHRGIFDLKAFWLALTIGIVSTLAELVSWRGSDNLSIPLSVVAVLVLFL